MRVTGEVKAATRQRILDAAKRLFANPGYDSATTRDIAQAARIASGTLFNYFPTKESIVECLVREAWMSATNQGGVASNGNSTAEESPGLEELLFSQVAGVLRKLKPYRAYLPVALEGSLSPLADQRAGTNEQSLRTAHLEYVGHVIVEHGRHACPSAVAMQLYWTLLTGVLAFWANDRSPRQEDTLALLDESLNMFVNWLPHSDQDLVQPLRKER